MAAPTPQPKSIVPVPPAGTLSTEQSAELMNDMSFRGRVKVCCLTYAMRLLTEVQGQGRLRWAQATMQGPDTSAMQIIPAVVMQPAVQSQGTGIDDGTLQFATEQALNPTF